MQKWKATLLTWGTGFITATLLAWLVAAQFTNGITPFHYDPELDEYVLFPGVTASTRSEGWAETSIGAHGFLRIEEEKAFSDHPKIILWGDSHVEGHQVDDVDKTSSVYNALATDADPFCISKGRSGLSVADYYFKMDKVQQLLPNVVGHAILISGLKDTLPGRQNPSHAEFRHSPMRLVPGNFTPTDFSLQYATIAHYLKLRPFYDAGKKLLSAELRFLPGHVGGSPPSVPITRNSAAPAYAYEDAWNYLLKRLKENADGYIFFIYCPYTPRLKEGIVDTDTAPNALLERFKAVCRANGVGLIDMTRPFAELYEQERAFPRGFFNSPPGVGHFNKEGHRLIGQAILDYVQGRNQ